MASGIYSSVYWSRQMEGPRPCCVLWKPSRREGHRMLKAKNSQKLRSRRHVVQHKDSPRSTAFPPHVPTMSSILYPIGSSLERRLMLGFSVGQAVILGVYAIILQYESLYKSNLFTDPVRTGFVATAQLPFSLCSACNQEQCYGRFDWFWL